MSGEPHGKIVDEERSAQDERLSRSVLKTAPGDPVGQRPERVQMADVVVGEIRKVAENLRSDRFGPLAKIPKSLIQDLSWCLVLIPGTLYGKSCLPEWCELIVRRRHG